MTPLVDAGSPDPERRVFAGPRDVSTNNELVGNAVPFMRKIHFGDVNVVGLLKVAESE
jgi:hypothetical protein